MLIAACYGQGEPAYATANAIVHALRNLGHEVIRVGPYYTAPEYGGAWPGTPGCDVVLDDRPFPEFYTYDEVLKKTGPVDLLLQIEPHFYFNGPKPKGVRSAYYFTDPHRGGYTYYQLMLAGNFDAVFCAQPAFTEYFESLPCLVHTIPPGFDSRRSIPYSTETQCDISFCGETGRKNVSYDKESAQGKYTNKLPSFTGDPERDYSGAPPTFDYSERAALLSRLCNDFDVRIYQGGLGDRYMSAIASGKIGFNRSLLSDINLRCYEVMAVGRWLVVDQVPYIEEALGPRKHYWGYTNLFKAFTANIDLEYRALHDLIVFLLKRSDWLRDEGPEIYKWLHNNCLWEHRMGELISYTRTIR